MSLKPHKEDNLVSWIKESIELMGIKVARDRLKRADKGECYTNATVEEFNEACKLTGMEFCPRTVIKK